MSSSITEQPLAKYIRARVLLYSANDRPPLAEDTLWYAGGVLVRFVETHRLFTVGTVTRAPVLADMYGEASKAVTLTERVSWLRRLGDTALLLGAIFPDNFARRGIAKDYFVGMGGGAYSSLAGHVPAQRELFAELSAFFLRFMRLLAAVCERDLAFGPQDIVALYERWAATGSPEIQRQLNSLGVLPFGGDQIRN